MRVFALGYNARRIFHGQIRKGRCARALAFGGYRSHAYLRYFWINFSEIFVNSCVLSGFEVSLACMKRGCLFIIPKNS